MVQLTVADKQNQNNVVFKFRSIWGGPFLESYLFSRIQQLSNNCKTELVACPNRTKRCSISRKQVVIAEVLRYPRADPCMQSKGGWLHCSATRNVYQVDIIVCLEMRSDFSLL